MYSGDFLDKFFIALSRFSLVKKENISLRELAFKLYEEGEYFVPEMLVSARAMQLGLDLLRPYLVQSGVEPVGKVAIGTIRGDLHDIGKNLVGMMLEGAGINVVDLGIDVSPEKFVEGVDCELLQGRDRLAVVWGGFCP